MLKLQKGKEKGKGKGRKKKGKERKKIKKERNKKKERKKGVMVHYERKNIATHLFSTCLTVEKFPRIGCSHL